MNVQTSYRSKFCEWHGTKWNDLDHMDIFKFSHLVAHHFWVGRWKISSIPFEYAWCALAEIEKKRSWTVRFWLFSIIRIFQLSMAIISFGWKSNLSMRIILLWPYVNSNIRTRFLNVLAIFSQHYIYRCHFLVPILSTASRGNPQATFYCWLASMTLFMPLQLFIVSFAVTDTKRFTMCFKMALAWLIIDHFLRILHHALSFHTFVQPTLNSSRLEASQWRGIAAFIHFW